MRASYNEPMIAPRMQRAAALAAGLLGAAAVAAQQPATDGDESVARYRIEFIAFAHAGASSDERLGRAASESAADGSEQRRPPFGIEPEAGAFGEPAFSDRPAAPRSERAPGSARAGDADAPTAGDTPVTETDPEGDTGADDIKLLGPPAFQQRRLERWFEPLPDEALTLGGTRRALERLGAYRVLAHAGWEQDELTEQAARPLSLSEFGISNPSGTLTLFVSRYAHVIVNLRYRNEALGARGPGSAFGGLAEISTTPSYVLDTRRRVTRMNELHYIDHPLFGLLVLITEAPEEPEQSDDELTPAA